MAEQDHRIGKRSDYKADVREQVRRVALEEPHLTQEEIGRRFDVSRSRVGVWLREMGVSTNRRRASSRRKDRTALLEYAASRWGVRARKREVDRIVREYSDKVDEPRDE